MSRPLRIEFPGATHHVTSRGDRREPIYQDDQDRLAHVDVIPHAMERLDAQVLAYCLMGKWATTTTWCCTRDSANLRA
jgi:putative transposase